MKAIMRDEREMRDSGIEWIGKFPVDWKLSRLKFVSDIIMGQSPSADEIKEFGNVQFMQGNKEFGSQYPSPTLYCDCCAKHSRIGDILMSVRAPVGAINESDKVYGIGRGLCSIRADKINKNFMKYYLLKSVDDLQYYSNGSTFDAVTIGTLSNFYLVMPSASDQQVIANYLDDRCSKIDAIIAEAKASIEEYKELKQAVIYEAVTKGLDKNVEMKGYGDWFDKCPSNWRYEQIRYLYELRDERNFEPLSEVNLISLYTDQGVMQHSDIEKTSGNKAVTADGYKKVYPEDIVVNIILCWMGAMGRSEYQGVTSPAYDVYKPLGCSKVCSKYYHYLFRTDRFSKKCYTVGRGIMMMRWRTYSSQFRAIKVPVPPYEEQVEIANYLDKRISQIEELVNAKQSLIEDLESYKKSLIYEVVTGKRKVVE